MYQPYTAHKLCKNHGFEFTLRIAMFSAKINSNFPLRKKMATALRKCEGENVESESLERRRK